MDKIMFGLKVKTLREHRNLSQSELAELVDISDNTLSNIETGRYYPRMDTFVAMGEALNVSLHFLVAEDSDAVKLCLRGFLVYRNYVSIQHLLYCRANFFKNM